MTKQAGKGTSPYPTVPVVEVVSSDETCADLPGSSCGASYFYSSQSPKWTFQSKQIGQIIDTVIAEEHPLQVLVPFAGTTRLDQLYPGIEFTYIDATPRMEDDTPNVIHGLAEEVLPRLKAEVDAGERPRYDVIISDPPWSDFQSQKKYGTKRRLPVTEWKNEFRDLVREGGTVVSFGWNSTGMSRCRGFAKENVYLVNNGGNRHDTIITRERRVEDVYTCDRTPKKTGDAPEPTLTS